MKNCCKKLVAFTLSEIMIVVTIIGIVAAITMKITAEQKNYAYKYFYYAAFMNLKQAAGDAVANGYFDGTTTLKQLPPDQNSFCGQLTNIMNTMGTITCNNAINADDNSDFSLPPPDGTGKTPNFVTTNGMRYFLGGNVGTVPSPIYKLYIDIDGKSGKNKYKNGGVPIEGDIVTFDITKDGLVYPPADSMAVSSKTYLTAAVRYWNGGIYQYVNNDHGIDYKTAVCHATGTYPGGSCAAPDISIYNSNCLQSSFPGRVCEVVIDKPGYRY